MPPQMEKVVPVLQIDDGDETKAFYVDRLGFELDFEWRHEPGFPVFVGVKNGDLYLHLSEHGKGHSDTEIVVTDPFRNLLRVSQLNTHKPVAKPA